MNVIEEKKRRLRGVKQAVVIEVIDGEKQCTLCKKWKKLDLYNKCGGHKLGLQTHCRVCSNMKAREYDNCPQRRRNRKLKSNYGITNEVYERMLKEQGGKCAICGSEETKNSYTQHFAVDHCHTSGKVRGLLCDYCNTGLGRFNDDTDTLEKAVEYLKKSREEGIDV